MEARAAASHRGPTDGKYTREGAAQDGLSMHIVQLLSTLGAACNV